MKAAALGVALACVACAASVVAMPAMRAPEPVSGFAFRFAPTDGETWTETEKQTKLTQAGATHRRVIVQEARTRVTVRREASGWRYDYRVIKVRLVVDGHDQSTLLEGLKGVHVLFHVDARGQLMRVEGLDRVVQAMGKSLPVFAGFAVEALVDKSKLEQEVRDEWTDRVAYWAGRRAEIGQIWMGSGKLPTARGPLFYHAATKVTERLVDGGAWCVRLRFVNNVNPAALAKISPEAMEHARATPVPAGSAQGVTWSSEGERVLEPATLKVHRERIFKVTKVEMSVPVMGTVVVTNEEMQETTWEYPR